MSNWENDFRHLRPWSNWRDWIGIVWIWRRGHATIARKNSTQKASWKHMYLVLIWSHLSQDRIRKEAKRNTNAMFVIWSFEVSVLFENIWIVITKRRLGNVITTTVYSALAETFLIICVTFTIRKVVQLSLVTWDTHRELVCFAIQSECMALSWKSANFVAHSFHERMVWNYTYKNLINFSNSVVICSDVHIFTWFSTIKSEHVFIFIASPHNNFEIFLLLCHQSIRCSSVDDFEMSTDHPVWEAIQSFNDPHPFERKRERDMRSDGKSICSTIFSPDDPFPPLHVFHAPLFLLHAPSITSNTSHVIPFAAFHPVIKLSFIFPFPDSPSSLSSSFSFHYSSDCMCLSHTFRFCRYILFHPLPCSHSCGCSEKREGVPGSESQRNLVNEFFVREKRTD